MKIIRPTTITDAILASSTVTETDYAAYAADTTYALADRVIVVATHKIYESLSAGNVGHYPPDNLTGTTPYWLEVSATNRWKAFDAKVADQTSKTTNINYVLTPGQVDALSLLNVDATAAAVVVTHPTYGEVYNQSVNLITSNAIIDAYTYCFEPFRWRTDITFMDLPPFPSASVSITLTNTGGTAKCGEIVIGNQAYLGGTEYDASVSITDYSKKEADAFGNYTVVERAFSKKLSCTLWLNNAMIDEVCRLMSLYRATPLVWEANPDKSALIIYGFYKSFDITIPYPDYSSCSLEIEGLT